MEGTGSSTQEKSQEVFSEELKGTRRDVGSCAKN